MQPPVTQEHQISHKLKQGVSYMGTLIFKAGCITDNTVHALELNTLLRIIHTLHKGIKIYSFKSFTALLSLCRHY
jgi:hypothetical protein